MKRLNGKVGVITGGVSGIGLGIARAFLAAEMKVVITYMREARLDAAMRELRDYESSVHPIRLDVMDRAAVQRAATEAQQIWGRVDVLCNNAGVNVFGPIERATFEDWDWVLGVNLIGTINMLVSFLPLLRNHADGGHIVNVASMAAVSPGPEAGIYTTSKFAVRGLSESLRYSLARYRIGVSLVCPGLVRSNIYESSVNRPAHLARSGFPMSEFVVERWKRVQELGMDPLLVGAKVLRGIQLNQFYIFTDPINGTDLQEAFNEMLQAFPDEAADPGRTDLWNARRQVLDARKRMNASLLED